MKTKLLTTNVDIAAVAAFGGLIVSSFCALFFVQHGLRLSVVAFAISLWGFLSLKHQDTPQPKRHRWRKISLTTALIVLMGGCLLFGTIKLETKATLDAVISIDGWVPAVWHNQTDCCDTNRRSHLSGMDM